MTLPPNCLSAEPSATPGDPLTGFGTPGQAPATALAGTPFASMLTQADVKGAGTTMTPGEPAQTAVLAPFFMNSSALYPGTCYLPFVEPGTQAMSSPVSDLAPTPAQAQASSPGGLQTLATTESVGEEPATPLAAQPVGNTPSLYPGVYYQPLVGPGPQAGSPVIRNASVQVPAQTVSADALMADASTTTEELGNKPETPRESLAKEKQKSPAKSEETASANPEQSALLMAYQFVAGQWVQQSAPQPAVSDQASALFRDGEISGNIAQTASSVVLADPSFENKPSGKGQKAGQSVVVPGTAQKNTGEVPALASTNVAPSPTNAVVPREIKGAVPRLDERASSVGIPDKKAPESPPLSVQEKTAVASTSDLPADGSGTKIPSSRSEQGRSAQFPAQEKIAAPNPQGRSDFATGVNPSNGKEQKKSLSIDEKELTAPLKSIGTGAANRENVMPYSAVNKSPAVEFSTIARDGIQANVAADAKVEAPLATHAPRLVQEIRQIADRISVLDRNSVELRFDFSATDRLSVRVEYRDGIVHTTFRTDSAELRDAISHEWQSQAAADQRPYRLAEPVYSQTTSNRQDFSSLGGDSSGRHRAFEQPAQPATPASPGSGHNMNFTTQSETPALAARVFRPETSHHLHALA